jgi:protein HIRA/HIR1
MKFFKPAWVGHDGNPIFSIDIHPDGTRFATGGQGPEKCGRVIIWNMAPIISTRDEDKSDVPKKLCQMDNHLACINCVRWSNHGKYLASAGDDKNLMVWQLAGKNYNHPSSHHAQSSVFESANVEQWRCIATLNGHNGDILDLAWSLHDHHLASCSVDNMIIVWDANNFPQMITKITGHTGLVKGVSWDPAGKYLASQSDDKTVRIWRTADWKEETVIKEPFNECGGTTHVLRLNWSPDGQTLVSAHAMNNSGSVAQLIERDGWKTQKDLVGHRKAVTCVRFNPNLLYQSKLKKQNDRVSSTNPQNSSGANNNSNSNNNTSNVTNGTSSKTSNNKSSSLANKNRYCCIAVGSRDRSISIWLTNQPRPLIVTHDLFESSVLDISWSKDGYRLLACSQDGTVAAMVFSPSELGHKLTLEEHQAHFQKLYGKSINSEPTARKPIIIEDPELIAAQVEQNQKITRDLLDQQSSHSNSISQNGFNGCESNTSMSGMSKGPTDRQIETLLPGGKRRITPLYIQPSLPFNSTSNITFSSSKESKTKIMIETTTSTPIPLTPTPSFAPTTPIKSTTVNNAIPIIKKELIASRTVHKTLVPSKLDKATVFRIKSSDGKDLVLEAENDTNSEKLSELRLMDETNNKVWDVLLSSRINSVIATEVIAAAACVDNSLHLFQLQSGRRLVSPIVLDSQVAHVAAEKAHILLITSYANMWLWDLCQSKVLVKGESIASILSPTNSLHTSDKPAQTSSKSQGKGSGDKANNNKNDDNQNNVSSGNDSDIQILSCSLTAKYQPLILLSTGRAFVFDYNLHCWLLISDSNDSITRWSSCKPSLTAMKRFLVQQKVEQADNGTSMRKNLPLASLQSQHSYDIKRFASLINKSGSESLQVKATRSYLDQQLASALAIKSSHEYHYWLLQSVQHFVDTGAESRLKDLCSRLASSTVGRSNDDSEHILDNDISIRSNNRMFESHNDTDMLNHSCGDITTKETNYDILGLNKLSLLKEVLAILSKDLRYQRIYSEYKQMVEYDSSTSLADMITDK